MTTKAGTFFGTGCFSPLVFFLIVLFFFFPFDRKEAAKEGFYCQVREMRYALGQTQSARYVYIPGTLGLYIYIYALEGWNGTEWPPGGATHGNPFLGSRT